MTQDIKLQALQLVLDNLLPIVKIALAILSVLGGAALALLGTRYPKAKAVMDMSYAVSDFRRLLSSALTSAASKLMNRAQAIHNAYDREMALAQSEPDLKKRAELERVAADRWEKDTEALAHEATELAVEEVGHLAPPWVKSTYKMGRALLEEVLPEVQRLFGKRN